MRALLDVNVLIALLDPDHIHHVLATNWLAQEAEQGWASCPITQNGCIRIMSQPAYPNAFPPAVVANRLAEAAGSPLHQFWPDDASLLDGTLAWPHVLGSRQVTDCYLLALAVRHAGRLVTFDSRIKPQAVIGARASHLLPLTQT